MILYKSQAKAVYSAIVSLNNFGFQSSVLNFGKAIVIRESNGSISVIGSGPVEDENYANQAAFAAAYGLD